MKIAIRNNKLLKEKDAKISVFSDITRGYGIFETLRTFENKIILHPQEHINRLLKSAKEIGLSIDYDKKEILRMLEKIAKKSPHKSQRIRIIALPKELFITSEPLKIEKKIYKGVSCKSISCIRHLPEVKSISYLPSFLSNKKAKEQGYFAAILTDKKGEVYECDYSNIFWFEEDILCTRKDKILPGIIRDSILKISPFKIKFKTIKIENLKKKKEIFLSNSPKLIVPITKIDKTKIGDGKPGKNTKTLMKLFQESFLSVPVNQNNNKND